MPAFCRHNRIVQNCPICSRDQAPPGVAPSTVRSRGTARAPQERATSRARRQGGLVVRRAPRAADDGYRSSLVPGIRGSADAERLALLIAREDELLVALALEPPPPWDAVAAAPDLAQAARCALQIVLGAGPEPDGAAAQTLAALDGWFERHGGAEQAFAGDPSWTPERRFARLYERLALPGLVRAPRVRLLIVLGASGRIAAEPASLQFDVKSPDDRATLAAKRVLASGDALLLDRRAAALADALGVGLAALDGALAAFEAGERPDPDELEVQALRRLRGALGVA